MTQEAKEPMSGQDPTGEPRVNLQWTQVWCARHSQPFRRTWPSGALPAMIEMIKHASMMPAVQDAANSDAHQLEKALLRFSPLCCFISREDLAAVYREAGVK